MNQSHFTGRCAVCGRVVAVVLYFLLGCGVAVRAQIIDTIKPNPNAVQLRKIWEVRVTQEGQHVGLSFGGLGDIYGIGATAWCACNGTSSDSSIT